VGIGAFGLGTVVSTMFTKRRVVGSNFATFQAEKECFCLSGQMHRSKSYEGSRQKERKR